VRTTHLTLFGALMIGASGLFVAVPAVPAAAQTALQPKEGWFSVLTTFDKVRAEATIPLKKGVTIIDSRPTGRQYDPGHIPGAINIPDSAFDKSVDKLPADKATKLIFYCGGVDCMLSHDSAKKAKALGYGNIEVYAEGMPDWKAKGGPVAVSGAYIKKLMDEKQPYTLIDARPKRVTDKGTIPTATAISDSEFDKHVDKLPADKAALLIYYCGGLECVLSDQSADKARKLGYTNVVTYPEGYPEWEKLYGAGPAAAAPASAATAVAAAPAKAALVAGKEKGSVTAASFEAAWKADPASILLVDVRNPNEFAAGTIKGAVNVPMNELEKKLTTFPKDKPIVFICGTGARSGEAYDTAKLYAADLQTAFLDANIKFAGDGTATITDKK
jgi:rhodanese-related sulfurtransferase